MVATWAEAIREPTPPSMPQLWTLVCPFEHRCQWRRRWRAGSSSATGDLDVQLHDEGQNGPTYN
jgi:hypothetical protein